MTFFIDKIRQLQCKSNISLGYTQKEQGLNENGEKYVWAEKEL